MSDREMALSVEIEAALCDNRRLVNAIRAALNVLTVRPEYSVTILKDALSLVALSERH